MLCRTQHGLDEEARTAEHARQLDIPAEVLDARASAALDSGARMDIAGSVHYPGDRHLAPDRLMASLQRRAARAGAHWQWNAEVTGWERHGRMLRSLKLRDGRDIAADAFVLCAGAWSAGLARSLGLHLPLEAGAGYSLTLRQPRQSPRLCAMLTEARIAVTPMDGALRFAGTMELAGLNGTFSPARAQAIMDAVPRYYPEFDEQDFTGVAPWRGLRPCSPDGLPYVGRTARCGNLVVATGHAMMGITLGPITGRLVASLLSDEKPEIDVGMLSPDRYSR
jgi:D-amino-acid dehydrogenase